MATISIHILSIAACLSAGFQQGYIASVLNQPYLELTSFINESWIERTGQPLQPSVLARTALAAYYGVTISDSSLTNEINICSAATTSGKAKKSCEIKTEHDAMTVMFMPWKARDTTSRVVRHAAWLGVMVKIAYVLSGARCIRAFSTFILHTLSGWSIDSALYESFLIGLARLPVTLVPVFLVDKLGRRPLMIISTFVSLLSLVAMMVGIDIGGNFKIATLVGLATLLLINACGLGSVSRFYAAELVPRSYLLPCVSTLNTFESLSKIAVEFAFYPIANIIGGQSLLLFIVPTAIFSYYMWSQCPETSKRPVNEVLNDIASRKRIDINFKNYGTL